MFYISDPLFSVRLSIFGEGGLLVSHSLCVTGFRDPQSNCDYHRRNADASLSSRFRLRVFQRVRNSSIPFFYPAQCSQYRLREHEIPIASNLTSSKTKRTDTPSTALNRVEIPIQPAIERHPTRSTKDDDSSTIISTSEQTPKVIGHSSMVSLV